jgi:hypothetical protein
MMDHQSSEGPADPVARALGNLYMRSTAGRGAECDPIPCAIHARTRS